MKYVGIDVSQDHLDFALLNSEGDHVESAQVRNEERAIIKLVRVWIKKCQLDLSQSLFCLEPTGHYSHLLLAVLVDPQVPVWLAHPMNIKQGLGIARGKSDKIDAVRIAQYARRFRDQARMFTADHLRMSKLKQLLMKRRQLVEGKVKLKIQLGNVNRHMHKDLRSSFNRFDKAHMRTIDRLLKKVELLIEEEINADPKIKRQYDLISSVPGVGPVLASNLLALTDAFTRFSTPRQLACHAGAAPFESTSGSSVRGRTRTSKKANSWLKSLLHMASMVAIRNDEQLGAYYRRKVAEGKPRLCVINAVRGKIIHRVCAVLRKDEPYQTRPLLMS
ncbi:MAG: IS110 family transposase [Flavobacteriales bacterium]|nr:IS110 family transposase [Flavobacteriales bacterium]